MRNREKYRFRNFKIFEGLSTLFKYLTTPYMVLKTFDKINMYSFIFEIVKEK